MGEIRNMHTKFWSASLNGTELLEDQGRLNGSVRYIIADFRLDITA